MEVMSALMLVLAMVGIGAGAGLCGPTLFPQQGQGSSQGDSHCRRSIHSQYSPQFPDNLLVIVRGPEFDAFHNPPSWPQSRPPFNHRYKDSVKFYGQCTDVLRTNLHFGDTDHFQNLTKSVSSQQPAKARANSTQHTLGHIDCPACAQLRDDQMLGTLSPEMSFQDAGLLFAQSKNFADGRVAARYVSKRTLKMYDEFLKPLNRFFSALPLYKIHHGHLRTYQEQRACGMLGPSHEELFAKVCKWQKMAVVDALSNPIAKDFIERRIAKLKHEEVSAAKVNQELAYLIRVMKRAGTWTPELEEHYQPLQLVESDIPKALTREEQSKWLATAASNERWFTIYYYSLVAFDSTASNIEMRNIRLGDINIHSRAINIRAATAKNKFRIRTIYLNPDAWIAMEWLQDRARRLGAFQADHFLFPSRENTVTWNPEEPMSDSGLKKPWMEVVAASGVHLTQHGCRHTAITRYAEAGVPIQIIMARAGHVSPKMTQHYMAISSSAQRWAMEAVYRGQLYPVGNPMPVQNSSKPLETKVATFSR